MSEQRHSNQRNKDHRFENNPPRQERFPQEHAGVEIASTARPLETELEGKELPVPQRNHAYGEFMEESHTKGVKKEEE